MANQYRFLMRAWDGTKMVPITTLKIIKSTTAGQQDAYCYTSYEQIMKSENLMLSTGWNDINGDVIFERDIIHFEGEDLKPRYGVIGHNSVTNEHEVRWISHDNNAQIPAQQLSSLKCNNKSKITIIGNTHENLDLNKLVLEKESAEGDETNEFARYIEQLSQIASGVKEAFDNGDDIEFIDLVALQFIVEELTDMLSESHEQD